MVVTHNGPLTSEQRLWVVVLAAPPGSALSGPTALHLAGFSWAKPDTAIHVTVPRGCRRPGLADVVVHFSAFLADDAVLRRALPRTRVARSVVDSAAWAPTDGRARAYVLASMQQRLATPLELRLALATRGPCRRHALLEETIVDGEGGIASVPEQEFARLISNAGLPAPSRQRVLRRPDGRYYLDACWGAFGVAAEVQGSHHNGIAAWDNDLDRHNDVTASGPRLLHFTSHSIRRRPQRVTELLRRTLRTGGWRG